MRTVRPLGRCLLLFLVLGGGVLAAEEGSRISASLDQTRITVGDRVRLTLQVDAPAGSQVEFPDLQNQLGGLTLKELGKQNPEPAEGGRIRHTVWAVVTAYATGPYVIAPLSVTVLSPEGGKTVLQTLQLFVEVVSVVPKGEVMKDVRDIKGPLALAAPLLWPWLLIAISLAGVTGLIFFALKRKRAPLPEPIPPPHLVALEALETIEARGLARSNIREYYFLVSGVLRRYLEDRFGFRAPEQTTEEFLATVAGNHLLNQAQKGLLKSFLERCDLVKFAKHIPQVREAAEASQTVRDFIHQTKRED